MADIFHRFSAQLRDVLDGLVASGDLPGGLKLGSVTVEAPRDPSHGDLSTNAAMVLAKTAGTNPRALAALIAPALAKLPGVTSAEIAGPGFINVRLADGLWRDELRAIIDGGDAYGRSSLGAGQRVNVEYVSANPTGPMHMGHCRGAVVGDALASLLEAAGYVVTREYYINDAGSQVDTLARSTHLRYREALGEEIGEIPDGFYPGDYLKPIGAMLAADFGDKYLGQPEREWLQLFKRRSSGAMMDLIRADLALLGIHHDIFVSEAELQASGAIETAVARLRDMGLVYEGTLEPPKGELPDDWEPVELTLFRSTNYGDDVDRPIMKSDGSWTYFGADLAYHFRKSETADQLIDIWGADHSGTIKRQQAAVEALTGGRVPLDVKIVQMVRLFRAGEPVKMSKRSGNFVTLADVVEEVGKDVVRFIMLTKRSDSQLDFDFAKVVEQSKDNPVFYVQYAHARVYSLGRRMKDAGIAEVAPNFDRLDAEELGLVKFAAQWPRIVEQAAVSHEPHRVAFYLGDLASAFHGLWNRGNDDPSRRFLIADDAELTASRLALARAVGQVIRNGLSVMGVTPVEEMH